jgi:hypothetical protein
MAGHESPAVGDAGMGKFVGGLLIGLLTGLIFADYVFPDGFQRRSSSSVNGCKAGFRDADLQVSLRVLWEFTS